MLVSPLTPHIGYANPAKIAKKAHHDGTSLLDAGKALGLLDDAKFKAWINPADMVKPRD